jgi:hypothetical protein
LVTRVLRINILHTSGHRTERERFSIGPILGT